MAVNNLDGAREASCREKLRAERSIKQRLEYERCAHELQEKLKEVNASLECLRDEAQQYKVHAKKLSEIAVAISM